MSLKVPISGIVTGFRIRKSTSAKDGSDYGLLDILQPGDKDYDSSLTFLYVQDIEIIDFLLRHYSNGQMRWIDTYCIQVPNGREMVWMLKRIFNLNKELIEIEGAAT